MKATEPIRNRKHIREMGAYYLKRGKLRNYLLIVLGVQTGLRISDLLRLTWDDVRDEESGCFRSHLRLTERKTGKQKVVALSKPVLAALNIYFSATAANQPHDFLFHSSRKAGSPIGRTQAWRIVKVAALAVGVAGCIGCHSLRKTLGYHAWKSGVKVVLLMDIFNHSSFDVTKRYLGISQDERDKVYLNLALF